MTKRFPDLKGLTVQNGAKETPANSHEKTIIIHQKGKVGWLGSAGQGRVEQGCQCALSAARIEQEVERDDLQGPPAV